MTRDRIEGRCQTSGEKSSMVRQSGLCSCMGPLYERSRSRQMYLLQLEQMLMFSFSSNSILH